MPRQDFTVDTITNGCIVPRQPLTTPAGVGEYVAPERLIPRTAIDYLYERYCEEDELLWAIEPCTPAASIAWRDEALLRGGHTRYALSTWFAVGDETGPKRYLGVVNFRPFKHPEGLRKEGTLWRLGMAEAFLVPPKGWEQDSIADRRYIKALTTSMIPQGKRRLCKDILRPTLGTVPFASQWHASGACGQTATYMMALMHMLPGKGGCRVEGPFSISCLIEDIRQTLDMPVVEVPSDIAELELQVTQHRHNCMGANWKYSESVQVFGIRNAPTMASAFALQKLFCLPRTIGGDTDPGIQGRVFHQSRPASPREQQGIGEREFTTTVVVQVTQKRPVFVRADLELLRAAQIANEPGDPRRIGLCKEFLQKARTALDEYQRGTPVHMYADRVFCPERPTLSQDELKDNPKNSAYHPIAQSHAVVVVGVKKSDDGSGFTVLYHDPWWGPYQELPMSDFFLAAASPFLSLVTRGAQWYDCPDLPDHCAGLTPTVQLFLAIPNMAIPQIRVDLNDTQSPAGS